MTGNISRIGLILLKRPASEMRKSKMCRGQSSQYIKEPVSSFPPRRHWHGFTHHCVSITLPFLRKPHNILAKM